SLNEGSGVDLNNDGRIDLVQHTYNLNNYYTLSSLINQGNGTFVWGQNTTKTILSGAQNILCQAPTQVVNIFSRNIKSAPG
ncbi:VCBS repeat-containing protein, partial [Escherichia coli]|nr:VCBS repeat-containing protein [Escherichia coli]